MIRKITWSLILISVICCLLRLPSVVQAVKLYTVEEALQAGLEITAESKGEYLGPTVSISIKNTTSETVKVLVKRGDILLNKNPDRQNLMVTKSALIEVEPDKEKTVGCHPLSFQGDEEQPPCFACTDYKKFSPAKGDIFDFAANVLDWIDPLYREAGWSLVLLAETAEDLGMLLSLVFQDADWVVTDRLYVEPGSEPYEFMIKAGVPPEKKYTWRHTDNPRASEPTTGFVSESELNNRGYEALTPTPEPTSTPGGDPPIYGNIMAFPTVERFMGQDLNGDGDINDTVLRYMNLETGEVVNTRLIASSAHHAMDIYENIIAFVGKGTRIRYYDINTGTVREAEATGSRPSIYGNIIAFASGGTICYFDLSTQTLVDTKVPGSSPAIYRDRIVFHVSSPKHTIWTYDLCTGAAVDTGIIGKEATLYENGVAFVTAEFSIAKDLNGDSDVHDSVIRYYDLANKTVTNTGAVGRYPALYGSRIAFTTHERYVNQDLNGDGKIAGDVIRYYDLETSQVVNTQKSGTEPDIYEDTITFYLWEGWVDLDLNGDGDQSDTIVRTYSSRSDQKEPAWRQGAIP